MSGAKPSAPAPSAGKKGGLLAAACAVILGSVYANEGGFVDHPADPGGPTNYGVTEKVARSWGFEGDMRQFQKHCSASHAVCADKIYIRDYIERPGFMPLVPIEPAVVEELVDTGVNMGPAWPSKWLQQSLNELAGPARLVVDGKVGPSTIARYRDLQATIGKVRACRVVLDRLDEKQRARYDRLVAANPALRKFYRGWINHRIGNVDRGSCGKGWQ